MAALFWLTLGLVAAVAVIAAREQWVATPLSAEAAT